MPFSSPLSPTAPGAAAPLPPPLRPWSRVWRYLLAAVVAMIIWLGVSAEFIPETENVPVGVAAPLTVALLLDAVLGVVALCLLPLRRRWPLVTAATTALLSAVSASAISAAGLAAVSLATGRRWRPVLAVGVVWVLATVTYEGLLRPSLPLETSVGWTVAGGAFAAVAYAACVATGFYVGARRELLASLRDRAETAEREQALKADAAREAERTRIAREMHDVLAHRISLVAMHAGALAYRDDLSPDEVRGAAGIIQDSAHRALEELRDVLGVLRGGPGDHAAAGPAEPPQPTLAELPALLAETREAGTPVRLDADGLPGASTAALAGVPETLSRTVLRIVQEALTNARKHAPGASVVVRLTGAPGRQLAVTVRNAVVPGATPAVPGSGTGLAGLAERAQLAGGWLRSGAVDGEFVVEASLPWPAPAPAGAPAAGARSADGPWTAGAAS